MSPRGAWRLESLGFTDVYDYVASKVDWLGAGLPFEGTRADQPLLATLADPAVVTCALDDSNAEVRGSLGDAPFGIVIDANRVVLGLVRAEALTVEGRVVEVMQEGPKTFRPHVSATEMAQLLDEAPQPWLLVTNLDGTLVGVADPDRVRQAASESHPHAV